MILDKSTHYQISAADKSTSLSAKKFKWCTIVALIDIFFIIMTNQQNIAMASSKH